MPNLCVIGLWHLGCVTAACMARKHKVTCLCKDKAELELLSSCRLPIFEPGLEDEFRRGISSGNLSFTLDLQKAVSSSHAIYIAFDTPVDNKDSSDTTPIENAVESISPFLSKSQVVIISSQLPAGTSRRLLARLGSCAGLCYSPENLRLGTAIQAFLHQERIVFGLSSPEIRAQVEEIFQGIEGERLFMSLESAEMAKHALNSYLASMISFSGEISDLCEKTGANAIDVMDSLRKERRVSPTAPLSPGLGFGGGTLARDVQALRLIGKKSMIPTPVLDGVIESNTARTGYVKQRLSGELGNLQGKKIAFFGLTYKPGTDTLRRSLALDIIDTLSGSGASLSAYDPAIKNQVESHPLLKVCLSAKDAAKNADAIVITTAWDEFKSLDWGQILNIMAGPVIIDARNLLAGNIPAGSKYLGVGVTHGK